MSFSLKLLKESFRDLSNSDAKAIKAAIDGARGNREKEEALETANKLLEGHGVEAIRGKWKGYSSFYGDIVATYVNTGDTYNLTIVYDVPKEKFYLTSYGDWVEWAMSRRVDRVEIW